MVVEVLHLGFRHVHDLFHRLGELIGVLAVLGAFPEGHDLQLVVEPRLRLDALGPEGPGTDLVPDGHGVQQGTVHIKNRALQPHGKNLSCE